MAEALLAAPTSTAAAFHHAHTLMCCTPHPVTLMQCHSLTLCPSLPLSPARYFGPALVWGCNIDLLWIYWLAQHLGALLAAAVHTIYEAPDTKSTDKVADSEFDGVSLRQIADKSSDEQTVEVARS